MTQESSRREIYGDLVLSEDGKTVTWDRAWHPGPTRRVTRITWKNTRHVPTGADLITAMWKKGNYHRITPPVLVEDYVYRRILGRNIVIGRVRDLYDRRRVISVLGKTLIPRGITTPRIVEAGSRTRFIIDYDTETDAQDISS